MARSVAGSSIQRGVTGIGFFGGGDKISRNGRRGLRGRIRGVRQKDSKIQDGNKDEGSEY